MSTPTFGFRLLPASPRLSDELVDQFAGLASTTLADAMRGFNFMDGGIVSRTRLAMCGRAVTISCRPGDNLMVHKALQVAGPGDILVVCTCGSRSNAVFGGLMGETAVARRFGGIVVDGAVRDVEELAQLAFPVFSRAVCVGGSGKEGPGEINVPISCGGTVVSPGDVVVGDRDGVAVVPRIHAAEVVTLVREHVAQEQARLAEIRGGTLFRSEIDTILRRKGVIA